MIVKNLGEEMNITFEIANENDCRELAGLKLEVWKTTYKGIYPKEKFENFDFEKQAEKFRGYILDKDGFFCIARDMLSKHIVGYCYAGLSSRGFKDGVPEIILMYVLDKYQKCGIGRRFFEECKRFLKSNGYSNFVISCNKYNYPAQGFYAKMGGQVIHIDEDNVDKSLPQIKYFYEV